MVEIYNEVVRDLLSPAADNKKRGLRVREHPTKGFYGGSLHAVHHFPNFPTPLHHSLLTKTRLALCVWQTRSRGLEVGAGKVEEGTDSADR